MLLSLKNEKTITIKKYTREFNGRMPENDILTVTVEYTPTTFDAVRELLTAENTSEMHITDDDGNVINFSGYAVDNMVEINGMNVHDIAIRLQRDHVVQFSVEN